jgi:hypothetical protein
MHGIVQLIYMSSTRNLFTEDALRVMLGKARIRNARQHVTGMLIYNSGTFMQVLEGREEDVQDIYQDILRDPRHGNLVELLKRSVKERTFGAWDMGFRHWSGRSGPSFDGVESVFPDGLDPQRILNEADKSVRMLMAFSRLDLR